MRPIRFYHRWIYRLFYSLWDPILRERPEIVKTFRDASDSWLQQKEREERAREAEERRKNIRIVK